MAQQSNAPFESNAIISVIDPKFCSPHPIELAIVRQLLKVTIGNFEVTDAGGKILFTVKSPLLSLHGRRQILDAAENPIATLRQKTWSAHNRWEAFRGDSVDPKDYIFNAKISSLRELKTNLDVFLAHNTSEQTCDFKVMGSWFERSCTIYAGESSTIIAQMCKKHSAESILLNKDKFMVTVYPNVDYAFIVALILLLDVINSPFG